MPDNGTIELAGALNGALDLDGELNGTVEVPKEGEDGYSPTIEVTTIEGGHQVAVTDVNGTTTFDVMDGMDSVFYAEYGVTTSAEISAAYRAGKTVAVKKYDEHFHILCLIYPMTYYATGTRQLFAGYIGNSSLLTAIWCIEDEWSLSYIDLDDFAKLEAIGDVREWRSVWQYYAGELTYYQGKVYKFIADHLGTWNENDVVPFVVMDEISGKYTLPSSGIPATDLASAVQTSLGKADTAYQKPSGGIPASDIASGVIPSVPSAYTSNPAALGTASPGSSSDYAKGDHVHPKPSASDLGVIAAPSSPSSGDILSYNGSTWEAVANRGLVILQASATETYTTDYVYTVTSAPDITGLSTEDILNSVVFLNLTGTGKNDNIIMVPTQVETTGNLYIEYSAVQGGDTLRIYSSVLGGTRTWSMDYGHIMSRYIAKKMMTYLNMGNFKIINVGNGTNDTDVLNKKQIDDALAEKGLPSGGTAGQILAKNSATDFDTAWIENSDRVFVCESGDGTKFSDIQAAAEAGKLCFRRKVRTNLYPAYDEVDYYMLTYYDPTLTSLKFWNICGDYDFGLCTASKTNNDGIAWGSTEKHMGRKNAEVPTGGTTGQVLAKASDSVWDLEWVDQSGGGGLPAGGEPGQVLAMGDDDAEWKTPTFGIEESSAVGTALVGTAKTDTPNYTPSGSVALNVALAYSYDSTNRKLIFTGVTGAGMFTGNGVKFKHGFEEA